MVRRSHYVLSLETGEHHAFTLESGKITLLGLLLHERRRAAAKEINQSPDQAAKCGEAENGSAKNTADKRSEACEVCLAIERAEEHARDGTLTEQTAKKIIGEILERTMGDPLQNYTAREWLNHWLDMKEQVRASKTTARYRQVVRDFIASFRTRANLGIAHINSKDILVSRNAITCAGRSARTANLSVKVISAAFNAALRQRHILSNPCTALETLTVEAEEKGTFSPAQIAKLLRAAEGDWRGAILLGYYTGARLSDVANMRWSAVDLDSRSGRFQPINSRRSRRDSYDQTNEVVT